MKLLVCGDRKWTDREMIRERIVYFGPDLLIHGKARGADTIAGEEAKKLGVSVEEYPPDLETHGSPRAYHIRNQQMIDTQPNLVLAFVLSTSRGTWDTVRRARAKFIDVVVIRGD